MPEFPFNVDYFPAVPLIYLENPLTVSLTLFSEKIPMNICTIFFITSVSVYEKPLQ